MNPERIQRSRYGPLPAGSIYVGRPGVWGNPWGVRQYADGQWRAVANGHEPHPERFATMMEARAFAVQLHRLALLGEGDAEDREVLDRYVHACGWRGPFTPETIRPLLVRRTRVCWCRVGDPCHGDSLLEIARDG